ncbi:hypothetical protein ABPG74_003453 [Tetrahymena malaccensis]
MAPNKLPKTMKGIVLEEFGANPIVKELPIPKPRYNEVLVKIEYASLNPMDLSFIKGYYSSVKKLPVTIGFEGCGTVVASGGGFYGWTLVGKKVAIYVQRSPNGCFAEYATTNVFQVCPVPDDCSFEEAASGLVNPMTVALMHKKTLERKVKAVVSNPAASALGRMLQRYFRLHGIPVINIVRRQEQLDMLKKEENAEYVLNTEDPNFEEDLKNLSAKLNATISFDAVGGPVCGRILKCMPNGSTAYVYGNLSMKSSEVTQNDLIFKKKKIKGFWLINQLKKVSVLEGYRLIKKVGGLYKGILSTKFTHKYPLEKLDEAVKHYLKNMSEGKILLTANVKEIEEIPYPYPNSQPQARL